ncbi:nucleoside-diphosphate-sugar epimerase [Chitinophaga dinghuensis]|uniref:Nucleoside-diphosphate-sugar epimerase n=1 Tax=Chitinophaga dinghuensis TaxID=1539050 RepID=A0A327W291_9BACT|nr:SDR family oxidoreductase [Chitinophaga dinghuensis]RAJ82325.1 nucleoside-diphosphate-sugar epimerase [Chitinophaga dinghuensis]
MNHPKYPRISILGCGWVGKPLAQHLLKAGYAVKGSRTTAEGVNEMNALGVQGCLVQLEEWRLTAPATFWDADVLIIDVPPRMHRGPQVFAHEMATLRDHLMQTSIRKVIFISSTSVYPNVNGTVDESCSQLQDTPNGQALLDAEQLLLNTAGMDTVVIRFGGLAGYNRFPATQARMDETNGLEMPVNLIHRDDCIGIITQVIQKDIWGEIFNACASAHPRKYDYLSVVADWYGLQRPARKDSEVVPWKIISNAKLKDMLGYSFLYDDPLQFFHSVAQEASEK